MLKHLWPPPPKPALCCCCWVTSVVSDSVRPHRRQPTRLPHPWNSPGKNTGVGCHFLLQCMKVKSESEVIQSCPTLRNRMDCSLPGSSIHGTFQARVLEWGATAFSIYNSSKPIKHVICFCDTYVTQDYILLKEVTNSPGLTGVTKSLWEGSSSSSRGHFSREALPNKAQGPAHPFLGVYVNNITFFLLSAHIIPAGFLYSFPALISLVFHPWIISMFISLKLLSSN